MIRTALQRWRAEQWKAETQTALCGERKMGLSQEAEISSVFKDHTTEAEGLTGKPTPTTRTITCGQPSTAAQQS